MNHSPSSADDYSLVSGLRLYKEFASTSSEVVAVFPFQYQTDITQALWGAESMPNIASELSIYFLALKGVLKCINLDLVNIQNPSAPGAIWKNAPVCQPYCVGPNLVMRDADGSLIVSMPTSQCQ